MLTGRVSASRRGECAECGSLSTVCVCLDTHTRSLSTEYTHTHTHTTNTCAEKLVNLGADLNVRNQLGSTALHYAAIEGHTV